MMKTGKMTKIKTGQAKVKKRLRLFEAQGGKCHWCGEQMILVDYQKMAAGEIVREPNIATFEHLDDRYNPNRGATPEEKRIVLACYGCNYKRGVESQDEVPIYELRRTAGNGKSNKERKLEKLGLTSSSNRV